MLDLAINGIDLGRGRGGNESYLQGLIRGLKATEAVRSLSVLVGGHFRADRQPGTSPAKTTYIQTGPYHRLPYLLWGQTLALRGVRFDWYLSTFFLPAVAPRRSALFVHDLSFLTLPTSFPISIRLYMRWLVSRAVARADLVFVLSNFIRAEFSRYYPRVEGDRVRVLYPGIDECFGPAPEPTDAAVLSHYGLAPGYILTVSSIHPRKNLTGLLYAYGQLANGNAGEIPPLVVVGQRYWGNNVLESQASALNVRVLGYVPQHHLPALYRGAGLFVYPSLYEGFGLPPVEALACGVPVLCDGSSSLPEAVGGAAAMVDMRQPAEVAVAMRRLLLNGGSGARRGCAGVEWAKRFNWQRSAGQLVQALAEKPG